jgi:hypothetical protein
MVSLWRTNFCEFGSPNGNTELASLRGLLLSLLRVNRIVSPKLRRGMVDGLCSTKRAPHNG